MSDSLDPRDELTERLAALGRQPVDTALQSQHLTAMAAVAPGRSVFRTSLAGRLKVAAGVLGGFLLGASGLTAAGAMGPLQPIAAQVAHDVAKVDVPKGPKDKAEKAAKEKAEKARLEDGSIGTARDWSNNCADNGTAGEYAGNRGQYLKQERAKGAAQLEAAKASTCGMPLGGDDGNDAVEDDAKVESEDGAQNGDAGKSDEDHGKATAPGQDKDKAQGPKDGQGDDEGDENKPETPAGPPAEAGKSGVTPPVEDPPATPTPDTPAPATDET
jgi:hypothetical protein